MFDVVLVHPEIPPNTGNVMRMCANTGCRLHLVAPLGFTLDDARMRRAGLDYRDMTTVRVHDSWNAAQSLFQERRMLAFTGSARRLFGEVSYTREDVLVFGKESAGLPNTILEQFPSECQLRIPMVSGSRSLNLSNSAAIAVYEGWRQLGYPHGQ